MKLPTLALIAFGVCDLTHAASLTVYLSAPGVESTFLTTGAVTETFDSVRINTNKSNQTLQDTYTSTIGTYSTGSKQSDFAVQVADQYGGASQSQYMTFGQQSGFAGPVSLTLSQNYNYFGFWWSAGDKNNGISLYDNNNLLLGRFSTADIMSILSPKNTAIVTSLDGLSQYAATSYYGNPNSGFSGSDSNEVFAYVSIITTGVTFNKVVLDNSGLTQTGFESDNHTVYNGQLNMPATCGGCVLVKEVVAYAPEPGSSSYAAIGAGAIAFSMLLKRLRR